MIDLFGHRLIIFKVPLSGISALNGQHKQLILTDLKKKARKRINKHEKRGLFYFMMSFGEWLISEMKTRDGQDK